ncbi:MAG: YmdB family metallophosphoesterase, partial [Planctomycetota bacterium]
PGGTAFQCDAGMTGPYASILGRKIDRVTKAAITFEPVPFHVASGDVRICGVLVTADPKTGKATAVERYEKCVVTDVDYSSGSL